jgi:hypothetical protein
MTLTRHLAREDLRAYFEETSSYGTETFADLWFSEMTQQTLRSLVERLKKK